MYLLKLLENEPVEWKKLGEISEITGAGVDKKINDNERTVTLLNYMDIYRNVYINKEIPNMKVTATDIKIKKCNVKYGDIFFTPSSETEEDIFRSSVAIENMDGMVYSYHIMRIRLKKINFITSCFLNYYFRSDSFRRYMFKKVNGNTRKTIAKSEVENLEVPIPSLEVQEKIVKTLDKFTEYVTELQTELQKRIDQYTYYRDTLLSEEYIQKLCKEMESDKILNMTRLDEVVVIKNGKDWKDLGEGDIPVYGSGGYMGVCVDRYAYDKPTVLIPRKGSIDNVFYLETPFWNVDTVFYTEINIEKLIPKYFYYFVEHYDLSRLSENPTRPSLTQSQLNKLIIPLPSLSLQHKIVTILDKFQTMIADAKGLLPREIEQRQQQYEYYREKLLTFSSECDSTHARTHARTLIISDDYYHALQDVAQLVDVDIEDKVILYTLKDVTAYSDERISWNGLNEINYVGVENLLKDKSGKVESSCVPTVGNFAKFNKGDILIGNIRPYLRKIWHSDLVGGASGDVLIIKISEKKIIESRYLYHILANEDFFKYAIQYSKGAKMPRGDKKKIMEYSFFVPPLHVQQRIVSILDTFHTLVHNMQEGLPKEIELRQQQYEYYRERLLSFPKVPRV